MPCHLWLNAVWLSTLYYTPESLWSLRHTTRLGGSAPTGIHLWQLLETVLVTMHMPLSWVDIWSCVHFPLSLFFLLKWVINISLYLLVQTRLKKVKYKQFWRDISFVLKKSNAVLISAMFLAWPRAQCLQFTVMMIELKEVLRWELKWTLGEFVI